MNIKKQIKLDIISMKPYYTLKNLIILLGISLFYSYINKSPLVMLSMTLTFAVMFSSNPFLLGENSGIDALYKIFSIDSKTVSYTHLTLPTTRLVCRSRWSPYH